MQKTKCEYCTFDQDGYGKTWNDGFTELNTRICKYPSGYHIEFYDGSLSADIHNCPMCGRPLAKGLFDYVPSTFNDYTKRGF